MNLLTEPWMPVRRRNGNRDWVAPDQLADPDIVAFDADRADFNGALAQFAIGLLQTTSPVNSVAQWKQTLNNPPSREALQEWFSPVLAAFDFNGAGARYMQDSLLRTNDGTTNQISALLIETPGENALRHNRDHFVKRGQVDALCPHCAALALMTLQINAPEGGPGYLTSVRGGGPLTTLLLMQGKPQQFVPSLWKSLWLNVQERSYFLGQSGHQGEVTLQHCFPWMGNLSDLQSGGVESVDFKDDKGKALADDQKPKLQPAQVHPAHPYWAMPRRIYLDFDNCVSGTCGICWRLSDHLIQQYKTKTYGLNYKGPWNHPLSPYYQNDDDWSPLHPQSDGLGYRHWLAWMLGQTYEKKNSQPSRVVSYALTHSTRIRAIEGALSLWVFGYDMESNKAICWYEATLPMFRLADCGKEGQSKLRDAVSTWLAAAELVASYLRGAVKDAWFSADAKGKFGGIDASFWERTEGAFYRQLKELIDTLSADEQAEINDLPARQKWHAMLVKAAKDLFDGEFVGTGPIERQKPARVAAAFRQLNKNLYGPKLRAALRLPEPEKAKSETKVAKKAA